MPRYRSSSTREPSEHSGAYVVDLGPVADGCVLPWRFANDGNDEQPTSKL